MINGSQVGKIIHHTVKMTAGLSKPVPVRVPIHRVLNSLVTTGTGWASDAQLPTMCKTTVGHSSNNNTASSPATPVLASVLQYSLRVTKPQNPVTFVANSTPVAGSGPLSSDIEISEGARATLSPAQKQNTVARLIAIFENKNSASSVVDGNPGESFFIQTIKERTQVATAQSANTLQPSVAQMLTRPGAGVNPARVTPNSPLNTTSTSTGAASGLTGAASGSTGAASGSTGAGSGSTGAASGSTGAASGSTGARSGSTGAASGSTSSRFGLTGAEFGLAGAGFGSMGTQVGSAHGAIFGPDGGFVPIYSAMNYQPFCFIPFPSPYMVPNFSLMGFSPLMAFFPFLTPSYFPVPVLVPAYADLPFYNFQPNQTAPNDGGVSKGATGNKTKLSFQPQTKVITSGSKGVQFDTPPPLPPADYPGAEEEAENRNSPLPRLPPPLPRLTPPLAPPLPSAPTPLIFTHPNPNPNRGRSQTPRLSPINNGNNLAEDSESEVVDQAFDFLNEDKSNN